MSNIDASGMQVAKLTDEQFTQLRNAEKSLNAGGNQQEVYLLAVTRH